MNRGECGGRAPRLVRLKVAQEVPAQVGEAEGVNLPERLLHAVLAEVALTGAVGVEHELGGKRFGDGDEAD